MVTGDVHYAFDVFSSIGGRRRYFEMLNIYCPILDDRDPTNN